MQTSRIDEVEALIRPHVTPGEYQVRGYLDVNYNEGPGGNDNNKLPGTFTLRVV